MYDVICTLGRCAFGWQSYELFVWQWEVIVAKEACNTCTVVVMNIYQLQYWKCFVATGIHFCISLEHAIICIHY